MHTHRHMNCCFNLSQLFLCRLEEKKNYKSEKRHGKQKIRVTTDGISSLGSFSNKKSNNRQNRNLTISDGAENFTFHRWFIFDARPHRRNRSSSSFRQSKIFVRQSARNNQISQLDIQEVLVFHQPPVGKTMYRYRDDKRWGLTSCRAKEILF